MTLKPELEQLASALDKPAGELSALDALDAAQLQNLLQGFRNAQSRQRADMQKAIDGALRHIPALLRGTVLRILRG
ncbi:MAG TPA: hypothetical protein VN046_11200 [Stenotrophobium sp.]|jgi:hypothetical protein|nr:hypothetical protein [Stenotrophobium sp.]